MIGIISALDEELMEIIDKIETKKITKGYFTFYLANIYNKEVVLGICGVGKVNSAIYTQSMIDNFSPSVIINIGVAGSTDDKVKIGDLVIGTEYFYHDFDCTEAGYVMGQIPALRDVKFIADKKLVDISYEFLKEL